LVRVLAIRGGALAIRGGALARKVRDAENMQGEKKQMITQQQLIPLFETLVSLCFSFFRAYLNGLIYHTCGIFTTILTIVGKELIQPVSKGPLIIDNMGRET